MKKALTITIAGTLFTVEEDAYERLDLYLKSIQQYFGSYPDSLEIVKDIEARIAEQLIENKPTTGIIAMETVGKVISVMGKVEDFGDKPDHAEPPAIETNQKSSRRLYRNPDDIVVAGVASGIATYFSIDPLIVRVIFIFLTFITSGGFIIFYIIFALIIPKAQTAAEKIQMKGGPVTLTSFKNNVNDYTETVKKNGADLVSKDSGPRRFIEGTLQIFGRIVRVLVKIVFWAFAAFLIIGGIIAVLMATFVFINLIFNASSELLEVPIADIIGWPVYYLLVTLGFVLALIPSIIAVTAGLSLFKRKILLSLKAFLGLGLVWAVALIVIGSLFVRYIPRAEERIAALPQNQVVTSSSDVRDFTKLELHGIDKVRLVQASNYSVATEGRQIDLERINFEVKDGILSITQKERSGMCFFCNGRQRSEITIAMPQIESLETHGLVAVETDPLIVANLLLITHGSSSVEMPLSASTTTMELTGNSRVTLKGSAQTLDLKAGGNSRFDGSSFEVISADLTATGNTRTNVNASSTLAARGSGNSRIFYQASPTRTVNLSGNARVISAQDSSQIERADEYDTNDFDFDGDQWE